MELKDNDYLKNEKRPSEIASMMSPAVITPAEMAMMDFLKSSFKIEAASVPVQAPVPGIGMATKRKRAR